MSEVDDIRHELMLDHGCILHNPREAKACRTCDRRARLVVDRVLDRPGGVLERLERAEEFEKFLRDQAETYGPSASLAASLAQWDGTVS